MCNKFQGMDSKAFVSSFQCSSSKSPILRVHVHVVRSGGPLTGADTGNLEGGGPT